MSAQKKLDVSPPPPPPTPAAKEAPAPAQPLSLVRFRAAAAAVGVSEPELKKRVLEAGVQVHQVVRGGELTAAVDLDDVWRLYASAAPAETRATPAAPAAESPFAAISSRLERELAEERAERQRVLEGARAAQAAAESARFERGRAE